MSDASDRTAARARLITLVEPTVTPALTTSPAGSSEIDVILDAHRRATTWAANTAYVHGAVVLPTVRNGHRYKCVQAGTSAALAADEPDWLKRNDARQTDGTSDPLLTWAEDGPDYANIYDVRAAAHEAWMLKAAKVSKNFNLKIGSLSFELEQVYRHCLEMANKYAPLSFG
jgi:hypothetical protein